MISYFDNKSIASLVTPFIVGVVIIYASSLIEFKPKLNLPEDELFQFSHSSVEITFKKEPVVVSGILKSPVGINSETNTATLNLNSSDSTNLNPSASTEIKEKIIIPKKLTFIIVNQSSRMAIINDFIVRQGDTIADSKVLRIEKEGVLINEDGTGEKWLKIE